MIQIISQGRSFCLPVKIPIWDASHLADERYEIAPGTCTRCPTMNWDLYRQSRRHCRPTLYRGPYSVWPSHNRQILSGVESRPCKTGTVKTAPGPHAGAVAGIESPQNREWEGSTTELAQFAQPDMPANRLTKYLNVNTGRLLEA